ncbi:RNA polymerase sigma factor [Azotobacter sp. CWF10]
MNEEQALIQGVQRGETAACETVIRTHHRFLIAMATPLVGADLATDVAQETWIRAFAAIAAFEGRSRLRTWLARIALNEAQVLLRRRRRELSWDCWGRTRVRPSPVASMPRATGPARRSPGITTPRRRCSPGPSCMPASASTCIACRTTSRRC